MSDQSIQRIKQQLQLLYPQLFDDKSAVNKLDPLITQSSMLLDNYKDQVTSKQYQQLIQLMTAHLLYQSEDNDVNSVQIADVHFTMDSQSKSGGSSSNGSYNDPYLGMLERLLNSLGFNDWSIQFG